MTRHWRAADFSTLAGKGLIVTFCDGVSAVWPL